MLMLGRYQIAFGWICWPQTCRPTVFRRYLWLIWVFKEAKPTDIDKKKQFPLGTPMTYEGRRYHYYKIVGDILVGNATKKKVKNEQCCCKENARRH